jgi:hypothetical protein
MSTDLPVSLQINLAPTDLPRARYTLPHQLRQWAGQVDEILLVLDLHRSQGRFSAAWAERLPGMRQLLADMCAEHTHARVEEVDYSDAMRQQLADAFFGGLRLPEKDWIGGPFYAYFFGLHRAAHEYVLHTDSDVMYGGGSQTWIAEALGIMAEHPEVIACNPLPGPPTPDGALRSQTLTRVPYAALAYSVTRLSTRTFLLDRARFHQEFPALPLLPAPWRLRRWQARLEGNSPFELPEEIMSSVMTAHNRFRVDFLGEPPGMWSLHPPYQTPEFFVRLPELIACVEAGDVPEGQRGYHDLNESMMDWSSARVPRWRRIAAHGRLALGRPLAAVRYARGD